MAFRTAHIRVYCTYWLKGKCVQFIVASEEFGDAKALHFSGLMRAQLKKKISARMFKRYIYIKKKRFCPHKDRKNSCWETKKALLCYLLRAMLCIKLMVRVHCSDRTLMWRPDATDVFSELLLLLFRDMLLIFSLYGFYKHVHITVLSFVCLWDLVLLFFLVYIFTLSARIWLDICAFYRMR